MKTASPMAAGAKIGKWEVLWALAWSVAVNTTNTSRNVRIDSSNHPALWGRPASRLLLAPMAALKPVLKVCTHPQTQNEWRSGMLYEYA